MFLLFHMLLTFIVIVFMQVLGVDFSDPAIWAPIVAVIVVSIGYVFKKAQWILEPLSDIIKTWGRYKRKNSELGKKLSKDERLDLWDNHIEPLLIEIQARLGNPIVDRLLGLVIR